MSVQLILYPQSYGGQFNEISSSSSEAVVNGINFVNLNDTTTYTSPEIVPYEDTLINEPASIINTWYRFRKGTIDYPTALLGNVTFKPQEISGVYQTISNLTIGNQYTITVNIPTAIAGGNIDVGVYIGSTYQTSSVYSSNVTQISKTFFAAATEVTIMISYSNSTFTDLVISSISTQPIIGQVPSGSTSILDNGQVICDLYEDEDLPLTLSVDNFKNVAEKVQSYSKAFNLPATKRNNKIFDQVFEITRSDDGVIFNVYKKTQCVLKQDGFILFEGYLRLLDVVDKEGEISYNVNLYSEVIALADFLKDSDFRALDFTELTHDYNKTNIKLSWNDAGTGITYTEPSTSGFRNAYDTVKYPFVDWNHLFIVAAAGGTPTEGNPQLTSLEQAFRPFINVKYLIDRIFEATPFTYDSDFFDTADFQKLFMDFNWGADNAPVVFNSSGQLYRFSDQSIATTYTTILFEGVLPSNFGYSAGVFTAQEDGQIYDISFNMEFRPPYVYETVDMEWLINGIPNMSLYNQVIDPASFTWSGTFTSLPLAAGDTILCRVKSSGTTMVLEANSSNLLTANTSSNQTTNDTLLGTLRGDTGQWEFLKGIITMFNLMTIPDKDNPNNILIEPYPDVFVNNTAGKTLSDRTIEHDWTDKIDTSEMKLTPLADLNRKTTFKFVEDDDDYAFTNYKNQVGGWLYGSKKYNAGNEFNILEGTNEVIAEPFAATVTKPLMSQYPQFIVPSLYAYNPKDDTTEGFENSPRIMYNNGIKTTGADYYIPAQNGVTDSVETNYLQFSHIKDGGTSISDYKDFHFGECQLLAGANTANNLFNLYWLPYYAELYNPNTRTMTIKVNLSPADINTFKFNDTIFIKNRIFRVNKIDYKPNDLATVEFILIP